MQKLSDILWNSDENGLKSEKNKIIEQNCEIEDYLTICCTRPKWKEPMPCLNSRYGCK